MPRPTTRRRALLAPDSVSIQFARHLATPVADARPPAAHCPKRAVDARLAQPLLSRRAVTALFTSTAPGALRASGAYCTCGNTNAPTAKFCTACGMPLAAVCLPCGQRNPRGARFCNHCGVALPVAPGEPRST